MILLGPRQFIEYGPPEKYYINMMWNDIFW